MAADHQNDFRNEIEYLADRAGEERARVAADSAPRPERSPIRWLLIFGVVIAVLELALLGYFATKEAPSEKVQQPSRLLAQEDCNGERYRTYRQVITYFRDNGEYPASLNQLVPKYVDHLPSDPATKRPLRYTQQGEGFTLECPAGPSTAAAR